jgi:hypothetical protein
MLKTLAKKTVRQLVRRIRTIADEPSPHGPLDSWAGPYTLNPTFVEVFEHAHCNHQYTWGVVQGANLAKALGIGRVSIIEFGVAGGRSLLALERIAEKVQSTFGVVVDVFGFDTGTGLTKPMDHRDMPNLWAEGSFAMNVEKLKGKLRRAQLILGPVNETVPAFIEQNAAPVAFVGFDVDLYTSTKHAMALFEADHRLLLPRIHCLFDDILGYTFGDHVGERLAIAEFNDSHEFIKVSPIHGLRYYVPAQYVNHMWEKNYMAHIFHHPLYANHDGSIPRDTPQHHL